jgi:hypothetical protein
VEQAEALPNLSAQFAVTYQVLGGREFGSAGGDESYVPGFDVRPRALRRPDADHFGSGSVNLLDGATPVQATVAVAESKKRRRSTR